MKRFFKVLAGVWISGIVAGSGCVCGSLATGLIIPRQGPNASERFMAAQIAEIQETLEAFTVYDQIAMSPADEFAGLGEGEWSK